MSIGIVRYIHPREESAHFRDFLLIGQHGRPGKNLDNLSGDGPMRLILGLGDHGHLAHLVRIVGTDVHAIERRGVVEAPGKVRGIDQLDADGLVFGAQVTAVYRRRTEISRIRPGIEGDLKLRVDHQLILVIQRARNTAHPKKQ